MTDKITVDFLVATFVKEYKKINSKEVYIIIDHLNDTKKHSYLDMFLGKLIEFQNNNFKFIFIISARTLTLNSNLRFLDQYKKVYASKEFLTEEEEDDMILKFWPYEIIGNILYEKVNQEKVYEGQFHKKNISNFCDHYYALTSKIKTVAKNNPMFITMIMDKIDDQTSEYNLNDMKNFDEKLENLINSKILTSITKFYRERSKKSTINFFKYVEYLDAVNNSKLINLEELREISTNIDLQFFSIEINEENKTFFIKSFNDYALFLTRNFIAGIYEDIDIDKTINKLNEDRPAKWKLFEQLVKEVFSTTKAQHFKIINSSKIFPIEEIFTHSDILPTFFNRNLEKKELKKMQFKNILKLDQSTIIDLINESAEGILIDPIEDNPYSDYIVFSKFQGKIHMYDIQITISENHDDSLLKIVEDENYKGFFNNNKNYYFNFIWVVNSEHLEKYITKAETTIKKIADLKAKNIVFLPSKIFVFALNTTKKEMKCRSIQINWGKYHKQFKNKLYLEPELKRKRKRSPNATK